MESYDVAAAAGHKSLGDLDWAAAFCARRRSPEISRQKVTGVAQRDLGSGICHLGWWWWVAIGWVGGATRSVVVVAVVLLFFDGVAGRITIRRLRGRGSRRHKNNDEMTMLSTGPNRGKISRTKAKESPGEIPLQLQCKTH